MELLGKGAQGWPRYQLFGLTLSSNFSFATPLLEAAGAPDLSFVVTSRQGELPQGWQEREPAHRSSGRRKDGRAYLYVYHGPDYDVASFTGVADFYLWPSRIICHLHEPAYDYAVEIYFLGTVLSLWFERQGIVALHASAAVVEDHVVAFLASNTGGKTSLAATLVQAGHSLLTDDILLVEQLGSQLVGRPGYPQMRMWPDHARHFLGHAELEQVVPHLEKRRVPVGASAFGSFCNQRRPLAGIWLPLRRNSPEDSSIETLPVKGAEALIELIRHSFVGPIVESLGWQPRRLDVLSQLVREVPLFQLHYPTGMEHMSRVRRAILEDLA